MKLYPYYSSLIEFAVKEKEIHVREGERDEVELNKKRHLNVVFIGHVGKLLLFFS